MRKYSVFTANGNLRYRVLPEQIKGTNTGYYFKFSDTGEEPYKDD
jgi:hypothetical protein